MCGAVHDGRDKELVRRRREDHVEEVEWEHLVPPFLLRNRQRNPSEALLSTHHIISPQQVLHCSLDRSKPTSWRTCNAIASSQNRHVKNILLGPQSSASIRRPYDNLGANRVLRNRSSYSVTSSSISATTIFLFSHKDRIRNVCYNGLRVTGKRDALWVKTRRRT